MADSFEGNFGAPAPAFSDGGGFATFAAQEAWPVGPVGNASFATSYTATVADAGSTSTLPMSTDTIYPREATTVPVSVADTPAAPAKVGDTTVVGDTHKPDHAPVGDKEQPKITLVDASSADAKNADITIKADGKTVPPNVADLFKDGKPHKEYLVAVEKGATEESISDTLSAMKGHIQSKGDEAHKYSPSLNDLCKETKISADLKKSFEKEPEEEAKTDIPKGGGGGKGGGDSTPPKVDETDKEEQAKKDEEKNAEKDTEKDGKSDGAKLTPQASDYKKAFATGDVNNGAPHSLGKYGQDAGNWFMGSCMTDAMMAEIMNPPPGPHWDKLKDVLKKHENDPEFQAKMKGQVDALNKDGNVEGAKALEDLSKNLKNDEFTQGFGTFLQNQQAGKTATAEEMGKYFNSGMQEAAFSSQMTKLASDMKFDLKSVTADQVQDLAIGFKLGHAPTAAEKAEILKTDNQGNTASMIALYARTMKEKMAGG